MRKTILFIIEALAFLLLHLVKSDLFFWADHQLPAMAGVLLGHVFLLASAACVVSGVVRAALIFREHKVKSCVLLGCFALLVFLVWIFPATPLYANMNYNLNKSGREKTVEMIQKGQVNDRVDMGEFVAPVRGSSYTKTLLVQEKDEVLKVLFCVYEGPLVHRVLVYTSDDSGLEKSDFSDDLPPGMSYRFDGVERIAPNWYSAKIA